MGKELERQNINPEALAVREVEGYIEKVEKSTEHSAQDNNSTQPNQPQVATDFAKSHQSPAMVVDDSRKKKILLPLTEKNINDGLGDNVSSGFKWLSEWCVMMIKKYPGRVFYSPPEQRYD